MKLLLISDLHVDFYCPHSANYDTVVPYFEDFYTRYMTPADAVCVAGDVANDSGMQVHFLRFLSTKYGKVYYVFGNHDIIVKGGTFIPSPFTSSEKRISFVKEQMAGLDNLFVLDGDVSPDGLVGGTMGMCDMGFRATGWEDFDLRKFWRDRWFDGRHWNYRGQSIDDILAYEMEKLSRVCEKRPAVVMTHFCPLQMGVAREYEGDPVTAVFYFDAEKYFKMLPPGTIWQCGHTHNQFDTEWNGVKIKCNPLGYPEEENNFGMSKAAGIYVVEI